MGEASVYYQSSNMKKIKMRFFEALSALGISIGSGILTYNIILGIGIILISIVTYTILIVKNTKKDITNEEVYRYQTRQVESLTSLIKSVSQHLESASEGAMKVINSIRKKNVADLTVWNFEEHCKKTCMDIREMLIRLHGGKCDFEVNYIRLDESKHPAEEAYLCGYANITDDTPNIFNNRRNILQEDKYYSIKQFQGNNHYTNIIVDKKQIAQKLYGPQNIYEQYISSPVICKNEKGQPGKMIGLLEILCLENTKIGENETDIKQIVNQYLKPYTKELLLIHKIEKALTVKFESC